MIKRLVGPAYLLFIGALIFTAPLAGSTSNDTLPDFKLKLIDGRVVNSKDLAGKVTVIDFWGTWCAPCIAEIPEYNAFYKEYKSKGVYFLALAADSGTDSEVRTAAKRLGIEYPVAVPTWDELDLFGNIEAFPTTMVFNAGGKLEKYFMGASPYKQRALREVVNRLLNSKPSPTAKTL